MGQDSSSNFLKSFIMDMDWFARFCFIGAILMLIDAIIGSFLYQNGYIVIIIILIILIIIPVISDDRQYSVFLIIVVMILVYVIQVYIHGMLGTNWSISIYAQYSLGYLGTIIINLFTTIILILIIISVGAVDGNYPMKNTLLFSTGFVLLTLNFILYFILSSVTLAQIDLFSVIYFIIIAIGIALIVFKVKLIGGFIIWITTFLNLLNGLFGWGIGTSITGFGAGYSIIGNIALLYFINALGLFLTEKKEEN